ncbi:unnamed protein product [Nippostrongylus brasiliensis]|uniref:NERD domain-containing protein n=1 Tax=Nippostrongylus brasiliensis TaxID=27835 RepID=A0A0N4YH41_NIPBR|nr:unnamed protein product [Nippostrongylus brasiliensis]
MISSVLQKMIFCATGKESVSELSDQEIAAVKEAKRIQDFLETAVSSLGLSPDSIIHNHSYRIGQIHYYKGVNFGADNWLVFKKVTIEQVNALQKKSSLFGSASFKDLKAVEDSLKRREETVVMIPMNFEQQVAQSTEEKLRIGLTYLPVLIYVEKFRMPVFLGPTIITVRCFQSFLKHFQGNYPHMLIAHTCGKMCEINKK